MCYQTLSVKWKYYVLHEIVGLVSQHVQVVCIEQEIFRFFGVCVYVSTNRS